MNAIKLIMKSKSRLHTNMIELQHSMRGKISRLAEKRMGNCRRASVREKIAEKINSIIVRGYGHKKC
jgi:hypothetical protein